MAKCLSEYGTTTRIISVAPTFLITIIKKFTKITFTLNECVCGKYFHVKEFLLAKLFPVWQHYSGFVILFNFLYWCCQFAE